MADFGFGRGDFDIPLGYDQTSKPAKLQAATGPKPLYVAESMEELHTMTTRPSALPEIEAKKHISVYHKLCHEFFTRGKESLRKGDLELAYYYFMKYVLMKLERLPLHPSYKDTTMDKNKVRIVLERLEFLKKRLIEMFTERERAQIEARRRKEEEELLNEQKILEKRRQWAEENDRLERLEKKKRQEEERRRQRLIEEEKLAAEQDWNNRIYRVLGHTASDFPSTASLPEPTMDDLSDDLLMGSDNEGEGGSEPPAYLQSPSAPHLEDVQPPEASVNSSSNVTSRMMLNDSEIKMSLSPHNPSPFASAPSFQDLLVQSTGGAEEAGKQDAAFAHPIGSSAPSASPTSSASPGPDTLGESVMVQHAGYRGVADSGFTASAPALALTPSAPLSLSSSDSAPPSAGTQALSSVHSSMSVPPKLPTSNTESSPAVKPSPPSVQNDNPSTCEAGTDTSTPMGWDTPAPLPPPSSSSSSSSSTRSSTGLTSEDVANMQQCIVQLPNGQSLSAVLPAADSEPCIIVEGENGALQIVAVSTIPLDLLLQLAPVGEAPNPPSTLPQDPTKPSTNNISNSVLPDFSTNGVHQSRRSASEQPFPSATSRVVPDFSTGRIHGDALNGVSTPGPAFDSSNHTANQALSNPLFKPHSAISSQPRSSPSPPLDSSIKLNTNSPTGSLSSSLDSAPTGSFTAPARYRYGAKHSPNPSNHDSERNIHICGELFDKFMMLAEANTSRSIETCGVLACKDNGENGPLVVTKIIIPEQKGTAETCVTQDEDKLMSYLMENNLIAAGWIHTHPSQECFLSSVDLHMHYSYQALLSAAVAVVVAPKYSPDFGIFRLTDVGMNIVGQCTQSGFHYHQASLPLFEETKHVSVVWGLKHEIRDLRCHQ